MLQIDLVLSLEGMLKNEIFLSLLNKVHLYLERKMNQLLLYLEGRLKTKFPLHLKGMLENKLLYFIPRVPMQTGPIKPKSFLDEYHTTGQEIAQAIKQQAVSVHIVTSMFTPIRGQVRDAIQIYSGIENPFEVKGWRH